MKVKFMAIIDMELQLEAVKQNGVAILYCQNATEAVQLEAVKQNGVAILYCQNATEAVQLEAVKQNGYALQHVLNFEVFKRIAETLSIEVDN